MKRVSKKELRDLLESELSEGHLDQTFETGLGVPKFLTRQATEKFVKEIKQHLVRLVSARTETSAKQREALAEADELLQDLADDVNELVQDRIWMFMRTT